MVHKTETKDVLRNLVRVFLTVVFPEKRRWLWSTIAVEIKNESATFGPNLIEMPKAKDKKTLCDHEATHPERNHANTCTSSQHGPPPWHLRLFGEQTGLTFLSVDYEHRSLVPEARRLFPEL